MRDALPVRLVQRVRDLDSDLQRLIQRQRHVLQPLRQRDALQVFHHQEVDPVLGPDVVERANVRMVQAGDGLRLALEPLLQIGVGRDMLGQHLDGDGAVEARVVGRVDDAHAACVRRRWHPTRGPPP